MAVGIVAAGGLAVYAGFRGVTPIEALREVSSGTVTPVSRTGVTIESGVSSTSGAGSGAALVSAARSFASDKYSQAKRWQSGYSDCSSFVGKAFKKLGITPPGASTTISYLAWKKTRRVTRSELQAGDLIYTPGHIMIAVDRDHAIGQQNRRDNVREGAIESLVSPFMPVTYLRYEEW